MSPSVLAAEISRATPELARDGHINRCDWIESKLFEFQRETIQQVRESLFDELLRSYWGVKINHIKQNDLQPNRPGTTRPS